MGILDFFNSQQQNPLASLLGSYYDPNAMKQQMLSGGLTGMGLGLLGMGPSSVKPTLGSYIGAAARGGIMGAQNAKDNYTKSAFDAYDLNRQKEDDTYRKGERDYQRSERKKEQDAQDAQRSAFDTWLNGSGLPEDKKAYLKANPGAASSVMKDFYFPDPNAGLDREYKKAQIDALNRRGEGGPGGNGVYGNTELYQTPDGKWHRAALSKSGDGYQDVPAPNGGKWFGPYDTSMMKSAGGAAGKEQGGATGSLPAAIVEANATIDQIDALKRNPNLEGAIGWKSYLPNALSSNATIEVRGRVNELLGKSFLSAYSTLKGGGQITEVEGAKAQQAIQRMETAIQSSDPATFKQALDDFKEAVQTGIKKLQATAGQPQTGTGAGGQVLSPSGMTSGGLEWSVE